MTVELGFPEWLSVLFFTFFSLLAWVRPVEWRRRVNVTALGLGGVALILLGAFRSILPLLLIPMAYWQTGQFTPPINQSLQIALARIDQMVWRMVDRSVPIRIRRGLQIYGEYAYIFCYPMVPSAVVVIYFAHAMDRVNEFWSVVLPPAYLCYATLPFFRTMPPRSLEKLRVLQVQRAGIRKFNLFIVRQVTHQANTFPSGHAAAAVAVALELTRVATPAIGVIYGFVAVSILAGAFLGRYHYAMDVLLGAVLAVIGFLLVSRG
jgi:PAP2 superfamily